MKCDFGKEYEIEDSVGCQREAVYLLQYNVDWSLLEADLNHPHAASMEMYSCRRHISDIDFLFDPVHGLPQRIVQLTDDKERPDLVDQIYSAYKKRHPAY